MIFGACFFIEATWEVVMKKKSHLSLSRYLIDSMQNEGLTKYRKSFLFGSILPDCIPSFITRRHTIEETFDILKKELIEIIDNYDWIQGITREFSRRLGVITHYIADYFTFPHNKVFPGTMTEHITYEFSLMDYLKEYLKSGEPDKFLISDKIFYSVEQICAFIKEAHAKYLEVVEKIATDCRYIVEMTAQVVISVLQIFEVNFLANQVKIA